MCEQNANHQQSIKLCMSPNVFICNVNSTHIYVDKQQQQQQQQYNNHRNIYKNLVYFYYIHSDEFKVFFVC